MYERTRRVRQEARTLGFDACHFAEAGFVDEDDRLGQWLTRGFHADMDWMAATRELRQDVCKKLPGARTVVVVARNYQAPDPERTAGSGRVARYARGRDYHNALRKPLRRLAQYLDSLGTDARSYASVDSGPVLERSWAARAGMGWIGKNSLVLRRDLGSYFFLGTVVTTVELAVDTPQLDLCGSCRRCIDACPTGAIVEEQVVDANRCISYHTIENTGEVPGPVAAQMRDWVFGCDICQDVCPWNRFANMTDAEDFWPRVGQAFPSIQELIEMDRDAFESRFEGTPLRRPGHEAMQRNARIVRRNLEAPTSGD